ncbi:hypothetical protein [Helicobacter rodentium]|uniref:hypothetical protein n=1 Tax=Helicobacter rodentium TaxID=59617 RepID=UPI002356B7E0|nr:hypothetical protein [Helicobacter rodentium]
MVLATSKLKKRNKKENIVTPLNNFQIGGSSIDLTLGEIAKIKKTDKAINLFDIDCDKTPTLSNIYDAFSANLEKIIPNSQNSEKIRNKIIQCLQQSREQKLTLKEIVIQILKFIANLK